MFCSITATTRLPLFVTSRRCISLRILWLDGETDRSPNVYEFCTDAEFTESLSSSKKVMSIEDHRALAVLESSVCMADGHYQLAFPWRYNPLYLSNSCPAADHRLNSLRRRILKDPSEKYCETVNGYLAEGHARKVQVDQNGDVGKPLWYLPYHPVFHDQKPGKVSTPGPGLDKQHLHLFGATSSPCCAIFALKKIANDHKSEYDVQTINTVNRNFYVDNCLKSVASVPEATRLVSQRRDLVRGVFHLTKWISNHREVLQAIPSTESLIGSQSGSTQWNVEADT